MRAYSGNNADTLPDPTSATVELKPGADFDGNGQIFYLRYVIAKETEGVAAVIEIFDQNEAVGDDDNKRLSLDVGASSTEIFSIPAPGIPFSTNIVAGLTGGDGTIAQGDICIGGYITGGM